MLMVLPLHQGFTSQLIQDSSLTVKHTFFGSEYTVEVAVLSPTQQEVTAFTEKHFSVRPLGIFISLYFSFVKE